MKQETRTILDLAVPAVLSQISLTVVQFVDSFFVSNISTEAFGSFGVITTLAWMITTFPLGFTTGISAGISRMTGAKDNSGAMGFFGTGFLTILMGSLILLPLLLIFNEDLLSLLQLPEENFGPGQEYYLGFFSFLPFIFLRIYLDGAFRASGDTKTPLLITVTINLINLALDPILIFPWEFAGISWEGWGIRGAAVASGISISIGVVIQAIVLRRLTWFRLSDLKRISLFFARRSFVLSAPSTFEIFNMALSQLMVLSIAVNPLGKETIASFHIVLRLASLSFIPALGFSQAAGTLTGISLGRGSPVEARSLTNQTVKIAMMVLGGLGLVYVLGAKWLVQVFPNPQPILDQAIWPLILYGMTTPLLAPSMVFSGAIRGAGETRKPLILMLVSRYIIRLPVAYFFGVTLGWGNLGIWIGMSSDYILRSFVLWMISRGDAWLKVKI
jgi:putative MATE family efflux protein